jgi:site-specific recombinase XerD
MAEPLPGSLAIPGTEPDPVLRLVAGWLADQDSPHTRTAYARDVAGLVATPKTGQHRPKSSLVPSWLEWCRSLGVDPVAGVTPDHVALYARTLEASELARTSRARKLSAVSSFYKHLVERGIIAASPAGVKRPKVNRDVRVAPALSRSEAHALIDAADSAPGRERARTSALIATLVYTGARVSELVGAGTTDLGINRGYRVLWVTRKGGKRQALALPGPAGERIDAYLAARTDLTALPARPGYEGSPRRVPLFTTETGRRLLPADVWLLVRRIGKRAGFPPDLVRRLGPHALRATFITLSLDAGAPIRDVQDAAGHESADTTRGYDRSRHNLDRAPGWKLAAYLADGDGSN